MNEVSFRNDILDAIDEIVTESSTDVLFSMLDASEKAMVILENCTDEDDIWKYSVWQEADENKGEEIDKDKHPFKESSTLKTILMLPINLIRLIVKVISQAFSPQKAEESSKLAAVATRAKGVFEKVAPFLFKEDGTINKPVAVTISGGSIAIAIEEIFLGKNSLIHKAIVKIKELWKALKVKIGTFGVSDIPEEISFTVSKKDASKYDSSIDFAKVNAYIDAMTTYLKDTPDKIKAIETAADDKAKAVKIKELIDRSKTVIRLCPVVKEYKQYTADEIAKFYVEISKKTEGFKTITNTFEADYKNAIGSSNTKRADAGLKYVNLTMDIYQKMILILANIQQINDTVSKKIADISQKTGGSEVEVKQGVDAQNALDHSGSAPTEATSQNNEYEQVTATTQPADFPTGGYFTKDADGKYVPVDGNASWDSNTTYYKKKTEPAAAANNGTPAQQATAKYDEESGAGPYDQVGETKPDDFDADPSKYFKLNETNGTFVPGKQGDAFEANKWYKKGENFKEGQPTPAADNGQSATQTGSLSPEQTGPESSEKQYKKGTEITPEELLKLVQHSGQYSNYNISNGKLHSNKKNKDYSSFPHLQTTAPDLTDATTAKYNKSTGKWILEYHVEDLEDDTPIDPVVSAWYSK